MQTKPTGVCSLFLSLVSYLVTWVSQTLASTLPKEFKVPSGWDLSSVSFPSHLYSCPVVRMMICFTFTHLSHIWGERWLGAGLRELVLSFYHVCAGETQVISFAHWATPPTSIHLVGYHAAVTYFSTRPLPSSLSCVITLWRQAPRQRCFWVTQGLPTVLDFSLFIQIVTASLVTGLVSWSPFNPRGLCTSHLLCEWLATRLHSFMDLLPTWNTSLWVDFPRNL